MTFKISSVKSKVLTTKSLILLQDGNPNCRNPNGGPENMGSCRMGGSGGPMGPVVSMGAMASEALTLPSNVISKQAGSMEVNIGYF